MPGMGILRKAANPKRKRNQPTRRGASEDSLEPRNFEAWLMGYRRRLDQICETRPRSDLKKTAS